MASADGHASTSSQTPVAMEVAGAEREPLEISIDLANVSNDEQELIKHIQAVAKQFVYHWKTFPIVLPEPFSPTICDSSNNLSKLKPLNISILSVVPTLDELSELSLDENGNQKRLNREQLQTVRQNGQFDVPSLHFPGQRHKWQLRELLQKGTLRSQQTLLDDVALGGHFLIVTAYNRLCARTFSLRQSFVGLWHGLIKVVNIFVGTPIYASQLLDDKIAKSRSKFLTSALRCENETELANFGAYMHEAMSRVVHSIIYQPDYNFPDVPYHYLTAENQNIDLRLFSHALMKQALPIVGEILENETRGWILKFSENLVQKLKSENSDVGDKEMEAQIGEAVMQEYLRRVYASIGANETLLSLGAGVTDLLIQQAQTAVILHKAIEMVQADIEQTLDTYRQHLQRNHPILMRIKPWVAKKIQAAEKLKLEQSIYAAHGKAIQMCLEANLIQSAYFLTRDLAFLKEQETSLMKELKKDKTGARQFLWSYRIWSPAAWRVYRHTNDRKVITPTVICDETRTVVGMRCTGGSPTWFSLQKNRVCKTSSGYFGWRLMNFVQRVCSWTWNMWFLFGIVIPWCSPLGVRAVFATEPFMPDFVQWGDGKLYRNTASTTQTIASRLLRLWRNIKESREHFENEPETGFLGKGVVRVFNMFWNYIIKGVFGTISILVLLPIVCLLACTLSLCLAVSAPLWIFAYAVLVQLFIILIYDFDGVSERSNLYCVLVEAVGWNIIVQGLLQPILAIITALVVCPLASMGIVLFGTLRYLLRLVWDTLIYHAFIKRNARLPTADGFAAHRIEGPGHAGNFYFTIKPPLALAAFETKFQLDELLAYQDAMEQLINKPQDDLARFVQTCFGPFAAQTAETGPKLIMQQEAKNLLQQLQERVSMRRKDLDRKLEHFNEGSIHIQMLPMDLKIAIQAAAQMLEKSCGEHVINRLPQSEQAFWDNKALDVNDWNGLASLMYKQIFSTTFLQPLSDNSTHTELAPSTALDLTRYDEIIESAKRTLGLTYFANIQLLLPYLDVSAFDPRSRPLTFRMQKNSDMPDIFSRKRSPASERWVSSLKLIRPTLPLLHPANIAFVLQRGDPELANAITEKEISRILESIIAHS